MQKHSSLSVQHLISGTWYEYEEERVINDTDEDGNDTTRYERHRITDCKTCGFR